ncbi:hypothetical protein D3C86_2101680 [compost metagenome]
MDGPRASLALDADPQGIVTADGAQAVLAGEEVGDAGLAVGEGAEHDGPVGEGLVARDAKAAPQGAAWLDEARVRDQSLSS